MVADKFRQYRFFTDDSYLDHHVFTKLLGSDPETVGDAHGVKSVQRFFPQSFLEKLDGELILIRVERL